MSIPIGARVKTISWDGFDPQLWWETALQERKWDQMGVIIEYSTNPSSCYHVRHDDGSSAWYEEPELKVFLF